MHSVAYATREAGRELCQSCSCSVDFPRGGSSIGATVKVTRPWKSTEVLRLGAMAATFGLDACIKLESGSACGCCNIFWWLAMCSGVKRAISHKDLWVYMLMTAWIEANRLTSLLWEKKKCSQLITGKIISMQIHFSAAKASTGRY